MLKEQNLTLKEMESAAETIGQIEIGNIQKKKNKDYILPIRVYDMLIMALEDIVRDVENNEGQTIENEDYIRIGLHTFIEEYKDVDININIYPVLLKGKSIKDVYKYIKKQANVSEEILEEFLFEKVSSYGRDDRYADIMEEGDHKIADLWFYSDYTYRF